MATFHDLRIRRRELLDDLDELEASVMELTVVLSESVAVDTNELTDHRERLAWLNRQRTGLLVVLSETERALLEFDADGWDE
jgi:hypothetical protein